MTIVGLDTLPEVTLTESLGPPEREITVTEQAGVALSDYAVKLTFGSGDPVFDKAQSDGSDIRYTDTQGDSSPYLEHYVRGFDAVNETAEIWVKIPSVPSSGSDKVYMYYGDATTPKASSPSTTFQYMWDSVEDGDVAEYSGSGELSAQQSALGVSAPVGSWFGAVNGNSADNFWGWDNAFSVDTSSGMGVIMDFQYVHAESVGSFRTCLINSWNESSTSSPNGYWQVIRNGSPSTASCRRGGHNGTEITTYNSDFSADTWHERHHGHFNGSAYFGATDAGGNQTLTSTPDTGYQSFVGFGGYTYRDEGFDEVRVRPFVDPEPDVSIAAES